MTQHHYRTLLYKQIASLSLADSAVMIPSLNENPFLNHSLFKKRTTMEGTPYSKIKLGAKPEFMPHYKDIPFLHHTMDYFKDFVKGLKDLPLNKKKSLLIQSLRVLCIFPLHQKSQLYFKIFLNSLSKTSKSEIELHKKFTPYLYSLEKLKQLPEIASSSDYLNLPALGSSKKSYQDYIKETYLYIHKKIGQNPDKPLSPDLYLSLIFSQSECLFASLLDAFPKKLSAQKKQDLSQEYRPQFNILKAQLDEIKTRYPRIKFATLGSCYYSLSDLTIVFQLISQEPDSYLKALFTECLDKGKDAFTEHNTSIYAVLTHCFFSSTIPFDHYKQLLTTPFVPVRQLHKFIRLKPFHSLFRDIMSSHNSLQETTSGFKAFLITIQPLRQVSTLDHTNLHKAFTNYLRTLEGSNNHELTGWILSYLTTQVLATYLPDVTPSTINTWQLQLATVIKALETSLQSIEDKLKPSVTCPTLTKLIQEHRATTEGFQLIYDITDAFLRLWSDSNSTDPSSPLIAYCQELSLHTHATNSVFKWLQCIILFTHVSPQASSDLFSTYRTQLSSSPSFNTFFVTAMGTFFDITNLRSFSDLNNYENLTQSSSTITKIDVRKPLTTSTKAEQAVLNLPFLNKLLLLAQICRLSKESHPPLSTSEQIPILLEELSSFSTDFKSLFASFSILSPRFFPSAIKEIAVSPLVPLSFKKTFLSPVIESYLSLDNFSENEIVLLCQQLITHEMEESAPSSTEPSCDSMEQAMIQFTNLLNRIVLTFDSFSQLLSQLQFLISQHRHFLNRYELQTHIDTQSPITEDISESPLTLANQDLIEKWTAEQASRQQALDANPEEHKTGSFFYLVDAIISTPDFTAEDPFLPKLREQYPTIFKTSDSIIKIISYLSSNGHSYEALNLLTYMCPELVQSFENPERIFSQEDLRLFVISLGSLSPFIQAGDLQSLIIAILKKVSLENADDLLETFCSLYFPNHFHHSQFTMITTLYTWITDQYDRPNSVGGFEKRLKSLTPLDESKKEKFTFYLKCLDRLNTYFLNPLKGIPNTPFTEEQQALILDNDTRFMAPPILPELFIESSYLHLFLGQLELATKKIAIAESTLLTTDSNNMFSVYNEHREALSLIKGVISKLTQTQALT